MVILNCPSRKGGTPVPVTERDLPRPFPYPRERSLHGLLGLESLLVGLLLLKDRAQDFSAMLISSSISDS